MNLRQQPYSFRFNIADGVEGVRFAHVGEGDEEGRVRGSYSYIRPDGILFTVRWVCSTMTVCVTAYLSTMTVCVPAYVSIMTVCVTAYVCPFRYRADENGYYPELIEEPAPGFTNDPVHGTATFTVALPHAEEFGVRVTAQELQQYRKQAALTEAKAVEEEQGQK